MKNTTTDIRAFRGYPILHASSASSAQGNRRSSPFNSPGK
ncbi:hypothetical protein I7I48_00165 [Histoplasma ohiense]|nr:hypothetical protein I7I48_00165 [Histoplasma ohiense (nom. inval.)]